PSSTRIDFKIDAVWYGPRGNEEAWQTQVVFIDRGWSGFQHAAGWGRASGGDFEVGTHRLELSIDGKGVASATFEVFDGDAAPSKYVQSIDGRVAALYFFESPFNPYQKEQRTYRDRFMRSETRFVYWELDLAHPVATNRIDFSIRAVWMRDGITVYENTMPVFVDSGWSGSFYEAGY